MRITDVRATPVNIPFVAPLRASMGRLGAITKTVIEVDTDEGITGLGESAALDVSTTVMRLRERLIGLDALELNELQTRCLGARHSFDLWENIADLKRALGGIEIALWDLRGRAEGVPLYQLLGGKVRDAIPFTEYFAMRIAHDGHGGESTPLEVAKYCARMVEEHDAPFFEGKMGAQPLSIDVEMVKEIRSAIGDERTIRLDTNGQWTVATAREALRRLEPYNVENYEDPVDTFEELVRLRRYTEASFSTHNPDLKRAVAMGVPDNFVLNFVELGGIRRTLEFVAAANMFGFGFWFHSGETGIGNSAYLQVGAVVESITEPSQSLFRFMADDVIEEGPHSPEHGYLPVPDGPGLGVTLDKKAFARCHQRFLDDGPLPSGDGSSHWLNRAPWLRGPALRPHLETAGAVAGNGDVGPSA